MFLFVLLALGKFKTMGLATYPKKIRSTTPAVYGQCRVRDMRKTKGTCGNIRGSIISGSLPQEVFFSSSPEADSHIFWCPSARQVAAWGWHETVAQVFTHETHTRWSMLDNEALAKPGAVGVGRICGNSFRSP